MINALVIFVYCTPKLIVLEMVHLHLILILNQPISVNSYSVILRSQQIPILKSLVYPDPGIELTNFLARGKHDNHYTDDYCCSIIDTHTVNGKWL
jgi:hypothetical protein